jgi:hypothetical protein
MIRTLRFRRRVVPQFGVYGLMVKQMPRSEAVTFNDPGGAQ